MLDLRPSHHLLLPQLLIDGILGTLVIFLVLELLICITAMLFGLSALAAGGNQVGALLLLGGGGSSL